jgi:hypothetical protein
LVKELVNYYKDHGTHNEMMRAYYLMGCAYKDMNEAEVELQYFQNAIDKADTTSKDCDYETMSKIYGQMAILFLYQESPYNMLESLNKASHYAALAKDTLMSLNCYEQQANAYECLNKPDSELIIREHASALYKRYGYLQQSALALGPCIDLLLLKGNLSKVRKYIDIYESESGIFTNGNIAKGKELYYLYKAKYYLQRNILDTAKYYCQKGIPDEKDFNYQLAAAQTLYYLYKEVGNKDSIAKYAIRSSTLTDSAYAQLSTNHLQQMQSMYDYHRNQSLAEQKGKESEDKSVIIIILTCSIIILSLIGYIVLLNYKNKRKNEKERYEKNLSQLQQTQSEITILMSIKNTKLKNLIEEKKIIIEQLKKQITNYEKRDALIVNKFKEYAEKKNHIPTIDEWQKLRQTINELLPNFYSTLNKDYILRDEEYDICILIRLNILPKDIAVLTGMTQQQISNIRARLLKKVFRKNGGSKEFDNIIMHL